VLRGLFDIITSAPKTEASFSILSELGRYIITAGVNIGILAGRLFFMGLEFITRGAIKAIPYPFVPF
jgi:hypothetical protein